MTIRFHICSECLAQWADRLNDKTYRTDCRRFVRDTFRGFVVCKGVRVSLGPAKTHLTNYDLEDYVKALAQAGMGNGTASYVTAVKAAIALEGDICRHREPTGNAPADSLRLRFERIEIDAEPPTVRRCPPANSNCHGSFIADQNRPDPGYRISHAQKSLSLFLKHMWCHGFLTLPPPVCVIDSIILRAAASCGAPTHPVRWTRIASISAYQEHLAICTHAAGDQQIAVWELFAFNGGEPPSLITDEQLCHAQQSFLLNDSFAALPGSDRGEAIRGALNDVHRSAFGRNPTWRVGSSMSARAPVHQRHDKLLIEIYSRYESGFRHSEADFIEDIARLVASMNSEFKESFR